ncbi:unnamed protein product [Prunus armeniaca]|uniref:F-box associated beta-propeller type 3 domain-containing protein n=1 Tax=Prunus armeniaca TaxID=36596 RepID=A0A6J5UFX0_PRUAR|nr:unnamed protein product [Prunus armeniaca]
MTLIGSGLGFGPRTNEYKVVRILKERTPDPNKVAEIHTLGTGSWKCVGTAPCSDSQLSFPTCVKGMLYGFAMSGQNISIRMVSSKWPDGVYIPMKYLRNDASRDEEVSSSEAIRHVPSFISLKDLGGKDVEILNINQEEQQQCAGLERPARPKPLSGEENAGCDTADS